MTMMNLKLDDITMHWKLVHVILHNFSMTILVKFESHSDTKLYGDTKCKNDSQRSGIARHQRWVEETEKRAQANARASTIGLNLSVFFFFFNCYYFSVMLYYYILQHYVLFILFLLSEHILCKESIVIVKKFDFEILMYLYTLRSPEFIYDIFGVMYV